MLRFNLRSGNYRIISQSIFIKCSGKILNDLGKMYASGGEFTENIDKVAGSGTAVFVAKTIEIYCN